MSVSVKDIFNFLIEWAPLEIAESYDNNGLQIGSFHSSVKRVLLSVDPSLKAVKKAVKDSFDLIITHHPLFFHPLKNINKDTVIGEKIYLLIKSQINLISWHTPLDKVEDGVSEAFLKELGFQGSGFVLEEKRENFKNFGLGRVVYLEKSIKLQDLARLIKNRLNTWVMLVGDSEQEINSFAFCGGSCGFLKEKLGSLGIKTLVTCDVKYHLAKDSLEEGFNFILLDHGISESLVLKTLREKLLQLFPVDVEIFKEESPYRII